MADEAPSNDLIALTADIVAAHVANNSLVVSEVPTLIQTVYAALSGLGAPAAPAPIEKPKGAVGARASIKPEHLISMIDGKPYKMLRRHLSRHGHTPESYREAYNLPCDYPMVAADYAEQRSTLARKIGLGRRPKEAPAAPKSRTRKPRLKLPS